MTGLLQYVYLAFVAASGLFLAYTCVKAHLSHKRLEEAENVYLAALARAMVLLDKDPATFIEAFEAERDDYKKRKVH